MKCMLWPEIFKIGLLYQYGILILKIQISLTENFHPLGFPENTFKIIFISSHKKKDLSKWQQQEIVC